MNRIKNGLKKLLKKMSRIRNDESAGRTLAELILGILIHGIFFLALGMIVMNRRLLFALGLLAGLIAAVFAVINMYDTLNMGLELKGKESIRYIRQKSFIRMAVALVLMLAAVLININLFIGVVVGLLSIKTSGLFNRYLDRLYDET